MATPKLNIESFDESIREHGYWILWQEAMVCNCMTDEGQPEPYCSTCKGRGWTYLPGKWIKGLTTSLGGNKQMNIEGLRIPGSAYVTPEIGTILGFYDRLTYTEVLSKFSEVVTMGKYETTATKRPIEKIRFVRCVDRERGTDLVYEEKEDFEIIGDRHHLYFTNDKTKPREGTKLSLLYLANPSYLVTEVVHEIRSVRKDSHYKNVDQDMARQYLIQREDFRYGHTMNADREEEIYNPLNYTRDEEGDLSYE